MPMAAYIIAQVEVTDPVKMEEYRKRVPVAVAAHGGKFLARGGAIAPLEGTWTPKRVVVIEFPSLDQAKRFWASPEYAHAAEARVGAEITSEPDSCICGHVARATHDFSKAIGGNVQELRQGARRQAERNADRATNQKGP